MIDGYKIKCNRIISIHLKLAVCKCLPDTNTLVNTAKSLKNHQPSMINEFTVAAYQEEIV